MKLICINCKHHQKTTYFGVTGIFSWHNCKALPLVEKFDLVTGESSNEYPLCVDARKTFCGEIPKHWAPKE